MAVLAYLHGVFLGMGVVAHFCTPRVHTKIEACFRKLGKQYMPGLMPRSKLKATSAPPINSPHLPTNQQTSIRGNLALQALERKRLPLLWSTPWPGIFRNGGREGRMQPFPDPSPTHNRCIISPHQRPSQKHTVASPAQQPYIIISCFLHQKTAFLPLLSPPFPLFHALFCSACIFSFSALFPLATFSPGRNRLLKASRALSEKHRLHHSLLFLALNDETSDIYRDYRCGSKRA
ncbi:hypothetical protein BX070DRAFT_3364 [Coemansia spiralis]|nr:hypothetical protein BX070DRAFT_3364 [Coemansia spiralis]